MNENIFALDIGTRSVVGVLMENNDEKFRVLDLISMEHEERAMLDGQIHNIPQVSKLVKKVKAHLEKKNDILLTKTSVAAAGRALVTVKESIYENFGEEKIFKKDDMMKLTLACVHTAQSKLKSKDHDNDLNNYYCVGYSATKYYLDDIEIGNLEGQKGQKAGLEIVAAFLPKVVIESLKYVVEDNDLELTNITLEPIAAINAILPTTMRKLNVALVDIGAGTSDIAISCDGAINAYGMVPLAGDEITEKISSQYILDFNVAEEIKRKIREEDVIFYQDILGFENEIKSEELELVIKDSVEKLGKEIAENILELNSKQPQAVILVGGGSLTPGIAKSISSNLGIPDNRIAIQSAKSIKFIEELPEKYFGPEYITPFGIGISTQNDMNLGFIQVTVNGNTTSVLNLGKNTVFDALLSSGIESKNIYGRPGLAKTIKLNGKVKLIPGTMGKSGKIKVNGVEARLDDLIYKNDAIEFIPGVQGEDGYAKLKELLPERVDYKLNGKDTSVPLEVIVDNVQTDDFEQEVRDNSNITIREINIVGEILEKECDKDFDECINIIVDIDGLSNEYSFKKNSLFVNDELSDLNYEVGANDNVKVLPKSESEFFLYNLLGKELESLETSFINVQVNQNLVQIPVSNYEIHHNNKKISGDICLKDKDAVQIKTFKKRKPILVDIFKEIDFSTRPPEGKSKLEMRLNGVDAEYVSPLKEGDQVTLDWR